MKVLFVFPNLTLEWIDYCYTWSGAPIDMYYIEANWREANYLIGRWAIEKGIVPENTRLLSLDDPTYHKNFYFFIAKDLSRIVQEFWVYPYSALNACKDYFVWIESVEIVEPEELKDLIIKPIAEPSGENINV
jgi:hypothetical protein